jgi:eukaryotic-like serine/threonine-protein kinase
MSDRYRPPPVKEADTLVVAPRAAPSAPIDPYDIYNEQSHSGVNPHLLAGRYEILGLIGVGGMGSVYRVRDLELEEVVALKVLRRDLNLTPELLDGFRREVKLARRVTHRNVARVFDIGEHEGERFLTMELVDGEPLSTVLARSGSLPVARALAITFGVCDGLAGAHAVGVVHRDLKPDNVLLAKEGRVVVTDFGIARAFADAGGTAGPGALVGTPAYMAPEQVEGQKDIDGRADIYALGALTYELFTGERAWPGESLFAVATARLTSPPPDARVKRPHLLASHAEFVMRCMARRPEDRFASAEQVLVELERLAQLSEITLSPTSGFTQKRGPTPSCPIVDDPSPLSMTPSSRRPPTALTPQSRWSDKTLAVLIFRNAGPPEDEYLAEELTDDLIDGLSMTPGLKVRARGAVLRFKNLAMDPIDIGRELGVQVVVDGSVRRTNDNIRISARLISVADGFQLWAKRFDRPAKEVLSINDEAASAIAEALTVDHKAQTRVAPSDPAAIDLYLRARHEYRKVWPEHQKRALDLFEQAEAIAPAEPMLLAAKAMALARRSFFTGERADRAREVAEHAVEAAPKLAESRLALGSVLLQCGESVEAIRELRQAVMRGPGLAEAHGALGRLLAEVGAMDEGIRRLEAATTLDPLAPIANTALARSYALIGSFDRADALLARAAETESQGYYAAPRARFALWRRDGARAEALLQDIGDPKSHTAVTRTLLAIALCVRAPERRLSLPTPPDGNARSNAFLFQLEAEGRALTGDIDRALDALRRSTAAGLIDLSWLERCPVFTALRVDARFAPIREQVAERAREILEAYRTP